MENPEPRAREVAQAEVLSDRHLGTVVCVGVDGSRAARQAVLWGAGEARLRHAPLLLVHVAVAGIESLGAEPGEPSGRRLLESSAEAASQLEPDVDVRTALQTVSSVRTGLVA